MELNKIHHENCLDTMRKLSDSSIDLIISSPPYFNLREYAQWESYDDYLKSVDLWFSEMSRIIKSGRHIAWNIQPFVPTKIANDERWHLPLSANTVNIAYKYDLMIEQQIIWNKQNASQNMFGSYPYPPTIIYKPITEDILIFKKKGQADLRNKTEESKIDLEFWKKWSINVWTFPAQTNSEHSAPFPITLPDTIIKMHSFVGDLVYDPFMGSGTTAVACKLNKKNYIGSEYKKEYVEMAENRLNHMTNSMFN